MFLPHPRVKISIVGNLRDREVACSVSDRQGSNFESCDWRTVSSQLSPSSGGSPGPVQPICAQSWPKARFISFHLLPLRFYICFPSDFIFEKDFRWARILALHCTHHIITCRSLCMPKKSWCCNLWRVPLNSSVNLLGLQSLFRLLGYKRVHLPLCKLTDSLHNFISKETNCCRFRMLHIRSFNSH